jgi:putative ABC transport system permease protein
MSSIAADLRHALRLLGRSPGYSTAATLILGLGIGANCAIFSVVNALILRPIDLPRLERVVAVMETELHQVGPWNELSAANYLDWKRDARSFERFAVSLPAMFNLASAGPPDSVLGARVTEDFFAITGLQPEAGRWFQPDEFSADSDGRLVVLSHDLWVRRFGANPDVVGSTIRLDGKDCVVTGIAPRALSLPGATGLWVPLIFTAAEKKERSGFHLFGMALLKPGVRVDGARAELQLIAKRLERAYPDTNTGRGAQVMPLTRFVTGPAREFMLMLMGACMFVLLIACANVANLQLARSVARRKELAVRLAIGATRGRIAQQLLTEGVVLSIAGGIAGVIFAVWGIDALRAAMPADVSRHVTGWDRIGIDWTVLLFAAASALASGVLTSLAPAIRASRPDLQETLRETPSPSAGSHRLRHLLVVAEVTLAVVLMTGASMMVEGFREMLRSGERHVPQSLLTFRLTGPVRGEGAARLAGVERLELLRKNLASLPGVTSIAGTSMLPYSGRDTDEPLIIEGEAHRPISDAPIARVQAITPDYFSTLRIPLQKGRAIDARDHWDSEKVVVVSAGFAMRYLAGRDPVGLRIKLSNDRDPYRRIVGVAGDVVHHWFNDKQIIPAVYAPHSQWPASSLEFAVRVSADPMSITSAIREQVRKMDPEQPMVDVRTLERGIHEHFTALRYTASLMGIFGVLATALSCLGIYGVISYVVAERTREIGIRMALGASTSQVRNSVLRTSTTLVGIGLAVGVAGAMALAQALSALIYGIQPADLAPYLVTAVLFLAVSVVAAWLPARRATAVDPMVALRQL